MSCDFSERTDETIERLQRESREQFWVGVVIGKVLLAVVLVLVRLISAKWFNIH